MYRWILAIIIYVQPAFPACPTILNGSGAGTSQTFSSSATSHLVNLPAVIAPDELLLVLCAFDGGGTVSVSGWTEIKDQASGGVQSIHWLSTVGTEDGGTVDVVTSGSEPGVCNLYQFQAGTWTSPPVVSATSATGTSTAPDSPSLTPAGGSSDYIWITHFSSNVTTSQSVTGTPANYINQIGAASGTGPGHGAGWSMTRCLTQTVEDPPAWTVSASEGWIANTVAVQSVAAAAFPAGIINQGQEY